VKGLVFTFNPVPEGQLVAQQGVIESYTLSTSRRAKLNLK
jgi:hypothetical protein